MIRLESFLSEVTPFVPNCAQPVAINAIRNALIEFCDYTLLDTYEAYPQSGEADVADYEIDTPVDTEISKVLQVWYNDRPLIPTTVDALQRRYSTDWREQSGDPTAFVQLTPNTVRLTPVPDVVSSAALKMLVALRPERGAATCTDDLLSYAELIGQGAVARLMRIPAQPFTSAKGSEMFAKLFDLGKSAARIEANRSLSRPIMKLTPTVI